MAARKQTEHENWGHPQSVGPGTRTPTPLPTALRPWRLPAEDQACNSPSFGPLRTHTIECTSNFLSQCDVGPQLCLQKDRPMP